MESFHSLLQKYVLDQRRTWESREQLHLAIITWTPHTYNNRRRQRRLGKLTPVEFELAFAATQVALIRPGFPGDPTVWFLRPRGFEVVNCSRPRRRLVCDRRARHGCARR